MSPNSTGIPFSIFVALGRSHHGCWSQQKSIIWPISIVFFGSAEATTALVRAWNWTRWATASSSTVDDPSPGLQFLHDDREGFPFETRPDVEDHLLRDVRREENFRLLPADDMGVAFRPVPKSSAHKRRCFR